MDIKFFRNVILKAGLLFLVFNLILVLIPPAYGGWQPSIYNNLVPGRERFPFGENPREAYNFSLFDVDAMFAAHEVHKGLDDAYFNIFLIGDSSVWGTLLTPQETLAGQLNAMDLNYAGKPARVYNLGYPTISLTKDLMVMDHARQYQPDLVLWMTTLEAMPKEKQLASPLAQNNPTRITDLAESYGLDLQPENEDNWWARTVFGRRRAAADWIRLQLYGLMWGATGIDQIYPDFTPAAWDLAADESYYDFSPETLNAETFFVEPFAAAQDIWGETPLIVVNEPIMISTGENSTLRYNFFYPRWAYDAYREMMATLTADLDQPYVDAWDWVPAEEFTNSAIHLTPQGEQIFAEGLWIAILDKMGQ